MWTDIGISIFPQILVLRKTHMDVVLHIDLLLDASGVCRGRETFQAVSDG